MRQSRRAIVSFLFHLAMVFTLAFMVDSVDAKKKKNKGGQAGGMQGSPFGQQKVQMIFITIREEYEPESAEHMQVMAKNFQSMMAQGGLHVGIVGTEKNQMVAIANTIRELVEIRKFAVNLEEVLSIEYDKSKFAGNNITEEERVKHNLPAKD